MVKQLTRSAVRVYGALSSLSNGSGSILEGLLPFFDPILRIHNGKKLDPSEIAAAIRDAYRWNFNADVVEAFVPHLAKHGWIVADIPGQRDTTYTIRVTDDTSANSATETVEEDLKRLAKQFKEFAEALSPLTAIPRDLEEFEDILVEWLLYVEAFSEASINFTARVRADEGGKLSQVVVIPNETSLKDEEKFLSARFVKHIIEQDESSAEVLARIASIGLLTEVVQDFIKPVDAVERTDLVVYLDAPVAMELLGVSGKLARENTAPVVEELARIGATIRVFGQSVDEIKNSLGAVLRNPRPTGPTATAMARGDVLRQFVTDVANDPVPLLERLGVQVAYRSLDHTPSEHPYFTGEQRNELFGRLRYAPNPVAREHDASITTFVARQRRGRTSRDIFKSSAVVMTRNGLLAQIVRGMTEEAGDASRHTIPPVVHRRLVATAMWLRTGLGAGDLAVPKRMLLANCERVLAIRPNVVEAVKRLTDTLGDEEKNRQLDLLINQDRSAQVLMDKTLGLSNVVTAENLDQLWSEMLDPHLEDERQRGREKVAKVQVEGRRQLIKAKGQIEELEKQRQQERSTYRTRLAERISADEEAIDSLCRDVSRRLRRWRAVRILFGVVVALACSIPLLLETTSEMRIASFVIGLIFAYLTATGGRLFGTNTTESQAFKELKTEAKRRGLTAKLVDFDIRWVASDLVAETKPALEPPANRPADLLEFRPDNE